MKILIIYQGSTGFTEKYAKWIGKELECEVITFNELNSDLIMQYDLIVYGGRVHVGKVDKINQFKKIMKDTDKKWLVFANGGTPVGDMESIKTVWSNSLTTSELDEIPHFYMQGGLNYDDMRPVDKFIMKTFASISQRKNTTNIDKERAQALLHSYDATSKEYIYPLIEFIKENYTIA